MTTPTATEVPEWLIAMLNGWLVARIENDLKNASDPIPLFEGGTLTLLGAHPPDDILYLFEHDSWGKCEVTLHLEARRV